MGFRRILDQLKANLNVYGASNSLVFKMFVVLVCRKTENVSLKTKLNVLTKTILNTSGRIFRHVVFCIYF